MKPSDIEYDAVIVGGGAAGLSAALVLGRCLRRVLLCDTGKPRNAPARLFNGYLSRDGSSPMEFLTICREQLLRYETVRWKDAEVIHVKPRDQGFAVTLQTGEHVTSRLILIATGLVDELPAVENLKRFYGKSVHSCPYCDGWEVRGEPIAVIGGDQAAADLAIELLLWSKDVVLCANGPLACKDQTRRQLEQLKVRSIEIPIERLEGNGDDLRGIRFADGTWFARSAAFISPRQKQQSSLANDLGCEFCEDDGCVRCDEKSATCVPGVYAAGNASRGVQLVIAAAAEGTLAAVAMNNALIEADAETGELRRA